MAKIEIKLSDGQNARELLKDALRRKRGKRGVDGSTPVARGSTIECGRLTLKEVLNALKLKKISIKSAILREKHGDSKSLTIPGVPIESKVTPESETIIFFLSITSERRKGVIFSTESEKQRRERQAEEEYLRSLSALPEPRGEILYLTLGVLAEELGTHNDLLRPWHFISFKKEDGPDGNSEVEVSLAPLDRVDSGLHRAVWGCVHAVEKQEGVDKAINSFETQVLEVLCDPQRLTMVRSLIFQDDI